ncbi:hypothetical protein BRADI_1g14815v3 [Brachypodium distachyon]|uniref:Uncharacterized protein n=1 Tax=Brachypodium distachyon TaxID=15368 RepID=A0A2K2DJJ8_BRADI|nr:hypothetical protein BRADI_1g14815v3 [Brachypodium distachyon]
MVFVFPFLTGPISQPIIPFSFSRLGPFLPLNPDQHASRGGAGGNCHNHDATLWRPNCCYAPPLSLSPNNTRESSSETAASLEGRRRKRTGSIPSHRSTATPPGAGRPKPPTIWSSVHYIARLLHFFLPPRPLFAAPFIFSSEGLPLQVCGSIPL